MDLADRVVLHELPGRYGDLIDDRDWDGLSQIFVDEATFEIPDEVLDGLEAIREFMRGAKHPRTHLMTNVAVDETDDGVDPAVSPHRHASGRALHLGPLSRRGGQDRRRLAGRDPRVHADAVRRTGRVIPRNEEPGAVLLHVGQDVTVGPTRNPTHMRSHPCS